MNKNRIIIFSLLTISIVFLSACSDKSNQSSLRNSAEASRPKAEKIEVINFHATQRCASCSALGRYSEEAIYEFFQPELRDGLISFQSVNVDLPENKNIAKKYQATGSSLFINTIYDGQDNIEQDVRVWRLLSNEQQFKNYFRNKLEVLLNE